jgi:hypothetical protein
VRSLRLESRSCRRNSRKLLDSILNAITRQRDIACFKRSYHLIYDAFIQIGGQVANWRREVNKTERYHSPYNVAIAVCNSLSNLSTLSRPVVGIMPPRAAA